MSSSSNYSVGGVIELCGPAICGVVGLSALLYFKSDIMRMSATDKISVTNLYNAVFGWAAIQTGCLFAMYGFVAGKSDGFIGLVRHTRAMQTYVTYLRRATYIGFLLTLISIPLIVTNYKITLDSHLLFYIVAVWFSLFLWAFCSFGRVAYIFGILVKIKEPIGKPAG
jgi:hypothetical protein